MTTTFRDVFKVVLHLILEMCRMPLLMRLAKAKLKEVEQDNKMMTRLACRPNEGLSDDTLTGKLGFELFCTVRMRRSSCSHGLRSGISLLREQTSIGPKFTWGSS